MFSLSTGEPPTPPPTDSVTNDDNGLRTLDASSRLGRTLAPQGRDSGYETSPAIAICAPSGDLHFFDRGFVTPPALSSDESLYDVFDDCSDFMILESEDNDSCPDCGESNSCTCSRTESSSTVRTDTLTSNYVAEPNVCDTSGQSLSNRMTSLPIIIPGGISDLHETRRPHSNGGNVVPSRERYTQLRELVSSRTHPGGFPSRFIQWWNGVDHSSPSSMQVIDEDTVPQTMTEMFRTRNHRDWRRRINSGSSDELSSDEDLLVLSGEQNYEVRLPAAMGQRPASHGIDDLSDLNGGSEPPSHERHRSQSLNLPHSNDQAVINVGRMLRRLSGEFEQRRTGQFIEMQQRSSFSSYFNKLS